MAVHEKECTVIFREKSKAHSEYMQKTTFLKSFYNRPYLGSFSLHFTCK